MICDEIYVMSEEVRLYGKRFTMRTILDPRLARSAVRGGSRPAGRPFYLYL